MSPVLITSAVRPASVADTNLKSAADRHAQCRDAVVRLLEQRQFGHYVIVDGSNVEIFAPAEIERLAGTYDVEIEQLRFQQDSDRVELQGKSYGELSIVYFALANSKLIGRYGSFTKLSGRYSIANLSRIMRKLNCLDSFFFFDNPVHFNFGKTYVSTIIYRCSTNFFYKNFDGSMAECGYDKHGLLETIFYRRLYRLKMKSVSVPFPYYTGISGVTGKKIVNSRYFIRNFLSHASVLCHTF